MSADINPADYDLRAVSNWAPPALLLEFARDELWPFLDSQPRDTLLAALARWLERHEEADERLRQLSLLDMELRRLRCLDETEDLQQQLARRIEENGKLLVGSYNEAPLDLPLPPPCNRTLDRDACLVALMAVNDQTRDPSQRIAPANSSLYAILCVCVRELREEQLPDLRAMLRTARESPPPTDMTHLDGLEGGRWLWWKNRRYDVPKGGVYRLLDYMWDRTSASYDVLEDDKVFDSAVQPQTVRSYANKANNALPPGFPWRLSADSVSRHLTKVPAAKGA